MAQPDPQSTSARESASESAAGVAARRGDIAAEMNYLVPSAEPAVVFSSFARLCVPVFSDRCTIDITENGYASYRISYPPVNSLPSATDGAAGEASVRTRVESPGLTGGPGYAGVITHTWYGHRPTAADVSQAGMAARHAITTIYLERLYGDAHHNHETIDQLRAAVLNNRDIGIAMGILMTTRNLTQDEAFSTLNTASRDTGRSMSNVAQDIVERSSAAQPPSNQVRRPSRTNHTNLGTSRCPEKP